MNTIGKSLLAQIQGTKATDQDNAIVQLAEKMVVNVKAAQCPRDTKIAVLTFIQSLDGMVNDDTWLLGDTDFCKLAADALERRHKPLSQFEENATLGQRFQEAEGIKLERFGRPEPPPFPDFPPDFDFKRVNRAALAKIFEQPMGEVGTGTEEENESLTN